MFYSENNRYGNFCASFSVDEGDLVQHYMMTTYPPKVGDAAYNHR